VPPRPSIYKQIRLRIDEFLTAYTPHLLFDFHAVEILSALISGRLRLGVWIRRLLFFPRSADNGNPNCHEAHHSEANGDINA